MRWTKEQQAAIDSRDRNLLLSAAAGSGKTAVLVQRIIGRLLDPDDPVEISNLLVMTFTRAAAAEMRSRIGAALAAAEAENPSPHIERQLALLGSAQISTIHAFCTQVIRQYFYRLDLDAGYRQGTETELALWRVRALDDVMLANYAAGEKSFYFLADAFRVRNEDDALREVILRLYDYSRSLPFPEHWLDGLTAAYTDETEHLHPLLAPFREKWAADWQRAENGFSEIIMHMHDYPELAKCINVLTDDMHYIQRLRNAENWTMAYHIINEIEFARWPTIRKLETMAKEWKEQGKIYRNTVKDLVKSWRESLLGQHPDQWTEDLRRMREPVAELVRLTNEFAATFTAYKKRERIIDFSDLEHLCLALLLAPESTPAKPLPSATARELAARYDEVMVDEYQDTNGVQELIASLVARANNRFMVGDVKQSIYRFRLADPTIFLEKYESYENHPEAANQRIDLGQNFRSDPIILGAVNDIFRHIMRRPHADMDYGDEEALYPGRIMTDIPAKWIGGTVSIHLLYPELPGDWESTPSNDEEDYIDLDSSEAQAYAIADEILRLRREGALVQQKDGSYTPLAWRDITVLLRSVVNRAEVFAEIFRQKGIPVYAEQAGGYFEAVEVQIVLALLALIDNSRRDLDAAAVLRSPLVGWDEEELAELRLYQREHEENSLFDAAQMLTETLAPDSRTRGEHFFASYHAWRHTARSNSVAALLREIYEDTGYLAYIGGLPEGQIRRANLEALYRRAREFDESPGDGLSGFLRYLDRVRGEAQDLSVPAVIGEGEDVVRIMTIHKSKGLEFPVVFVAHTEKEFNQQDLNKRVLLHREAGIGLYAYDPATEVSYPTVLHYLLREKLACEALAEEQRLLYVAMTRARDKLYLYGYVRQFEEKREEILAKWATDDSYGATAKSYLDWLMTTLYHHPDAAHLWATAGEPENDPEGKWSIDFIAVPPMALTEEINQMENPYMAAIQAGKPTGYELPAEIATKLAWRYPHCEATEIPAKVTVTELTHRLREIAASAGLETASIKIPAFGAMHSASVPDEKEAVRLVPALPADEETEFLGDLGDFERQPEFLAMTTDDGSGAAYGSLVHRLMEHLAKVEMTEMATAREQLIRRGLIDPADAAVVPLEDLEKWARSDAAKRLRKAAADWHEMPFGLLVPATLIFAADSLHGDEIFLQGVIDCLFREGDSLVIIDYKTDRVRDIATLLRRYRRQLDLYAYAAERIFRLPVKEKIIYSFALGEEITWQ